METLCCIKDLHMLESVLLLACKDLKSLPELPGSLKSLYAQDCESLETVFCPLNTPFAKLTFTSCFKLGQQARNYIIHQRLHRSLQLGWSCLPGNEVPAAFEHRAMGNTLTFPLSAFCQFKVCIVYSPGNVPDSYFKYYLFCRRIRKSYSYPIKKSSFVKFSIISYQPKHLFVFHSDLLLKNGYLEESGDIMFKFTSKFNYVNIIDCGVQILNFDLNRSYEFSGSDDKDGDGNHWNTHESGQDSNEDEEADIISDTRSESGPSNYEEDTISVSRKRARNTTMTGASTNMKWGTKRRRL